MKTKEQKKKDRERESRKKVLLRRAKIREKTKKEREDAKEQREYQKMANRAEGRTYVNRDPDQQHALLQHNMAILEALKEQADANAPPEEKKSSMGASADVTFTPAGE